MPPVAVWNLMNQATRSPAGTPPVDLKTAVPGLLASPEEAAERELAGREELDRNIALLDRALGALWSCNCCGTAGAAAFDPSGLCDPCRQAVARVQAERALADKIGGRTRRQLAEQFLDAQNGA
jgi:hypothetical protein